MHRGDEPPRGLRVIAFTVLPLAYQLVHNWTEAHGHQIVLLVTSPGPASDRNDAYQKVIANAAREQDILVATRPKEIAEKLALWRPDLVVCVNFPHLIPMELVRSARLGGVNLHATPLPRYRGPNPLRMVYDGSPVVGATLHRLAPAFDTGPILSVEKRPVPEPVTVEGVWAAWTEALLTAFNEGMERCVRGEPGVAQEPGDGSYAGIFSDEERRLDWAMPSRTLVHRCVALNMFGGPAWGVICGVLRQVRSVRMFDLSRPEAASGTALSSTETAAAVVTVDGVVEVTLEPLHACGS